MAFTRRKRSYKTPTGFSSIEEEFDSLEAAAKPSDLVDFYLQKCAIVASHIADIAAGSLAGLGPKDFRQLILADYIKLSLDRAEKADTGRVLDRRCGDIWQRYAAISRGIRAWPGDLNQRTAIAYVMFVASIVILRLYGSQASAETLGIAYSFGIAAGSMPIPMNWTEPLEQQAAIVSRNLQWVFLLYPNQQL